MHSPSMQFKLRLNSEHDCFAAFSGSFEIKNVKYIHIKGEQGQCLPLEINNISVGDNDATLYMNGLLAFKNAISLDNQFTMLPIKNENVCALTHVHLHPETGNDWEIVMDSKEVIQVTLLQQIHVLQPGMIFPFWNGNVCLFLSVGKLAPNFSQETVGLLTPNTEVIVDPAPAPPLRPETVANCNTAITAVEKPTSSPSLPGIWKLVDLLLWLWCGRSLSLVQQQRGLVRHWWTHFQQHHDSFATLGLSVGGVYRVFQDTMVTTTDDQEETFPIPMATLYISSWRPQSPIVPAVVLLARFTLQLEDKSTKRFYLPLRVKPRTQSSYPGDILALPRVYFRPESRLLQMGDNVAVELVNLQHCTLNLPKSITLQVVSPCEKPLAEVFYNVAFHHWISLHTSRDSPLVVAGAASNNSEMVGTLVRVPLDVEHSATIRVVPVASFAVESSMSEHNSLPLFILSEDMLKGVQLKVEFHKMQDNLQKPRTKSNPLLTLQEPMESVKTSASRHLGWYIQHALCENNLTNPSPLLLLYGTCGTGKSTLMNQVASFLREEPWLQTFCVRVDCASLSGKSLDSLRKTLTSVRIWLLEREPSMLLLDNLDVLCPRVDVTRNSPGEMIVHEAITLMVQVMLTSLTSSDKQQGRPPRVAIIASCQSPLSLHPHLDTQTFHTIYQIPPLSEEERGVVLRHHLQLHWRHFLTTPPPVICISCLQQWDTFLPQDWCEVAKSLLCNTALKADTKDVVATSPTSTSTVVTEEELASVLTTYQQAHSGGVSEQKVTFADIAGYAHVRRTLREVFLWPVKYRHIYQQCPIPLQHGVLLYGPSGCGKTFLGKALAAETSMSFQLVKGPELLNKFVGSSEKAVRDLFQRARRVAPCLLFFDEFEALAPRRGHDLTGVTDRVVNQLLAEIDGFEERGNVYILAASNRPDLIDPALLRPGRLQVKLFVDFPTQEERQLLIHSLMERQLRLRVAPTHSKDAIVEEVLQLSEGYSVADLKGFLLVVKTEALRESTALVDDFVEIHDTHVEAARRLFRPSRPMDVDYGGLWTTPKNIPVPSHQKATLA